MAEGSMTARTFRKKTPITAVQLTEDMVSGQEPLPAGVVVISKDDIIVTTLEGALSVQAGYWIATGPNGEHWGIRPDIFAKTYEEILS